MDAGDLVKRYYDALDEHDYDELESILAPTFVQRRPDREFDGRDAFVDFMRDERPVPDTQHELDDLFGDETNVAARGRLLRDGDKLFAFADHFVVGGNTIRRLETYTR